MVLSKRLKRNDQGINDLDRACKEHDIAYEKSKSKVERNKADKILAEKAWKQAKTSEAGWSERLASAATAGVMTVKSKLGFGLKRRRRRQRKSKTNEKRKTTATRNNNNNKKKKKLVKKQKKKSIKKRKKSNNKNLWNKSEVRKLYKGAVKNAKESIVVKKPQSIKQAVKIGVNAAKKIFNQNEGKPSRVTAINNLPRVTPVPKIGGVIPLISILSGLSALGGIMGGVAGITNAFTRINNAKQNFKESKRHNETMEAIALGKTSKNKHGSGMILGPYKKGLGLYLHEIPKN